MIRSPSSRRSVPRPPWRGCATGSSRTIIPKLRPATADLYRLLIDGPKAKPGRGQPRAAAFEGLRKAWGSRKVEDITHADVEALHARVTRLAPYTANRLASPSVAHASRWRSAGDGGRDNPVKGIERNQEVKRQRFLRPDEIGRLTAALAAFPDQQAADIVRLLTLTGARRNEVLAMRWDQLDLGARRLDQAGRARPSRRPSTACRCRRRRGSCSPASRRKASGCFPAPARAGTARASRAPGRRSAAPPGSWGRTASRTCGSTIFGIPTPACSPRAGLSLPIIGPLLGHTQPQTTARYAHLLDDPLRAATERVAAIVSGTETTAEIVAFGGRE